MEWTLILVVARYVYTFDLRVCPITAQDSSSTWKALRDPQLADLFEAAIGDKFAALYLLKENVDNPTENINGTLIDIASEVLSKAKKPQMTNFWIDVTVEDASRKAESWSWSMRSQARNQKKNEADKRKLDHRPVSRNWFRNHNRTR